MQSIPQSIPPSLTDQRFLIYICTVPTATRSHADPGLDRAATLFHALSDDTRLSILEMLRGGERCVCDLQDDLDAAQSRLSFHLRVLRDAGLVEDRREGRWAYYRIVPKALGEVHDLVVAMQPRHAGASRLRSRACCR